MTEVFAMAILSCMRLFPLEGRDGVQSSLLRTYWVNVFWCIFEPRVFFCSLLCWCRTETGVGICFSTLRGGAYLVVYGDDCFVASTLGGGAQFYES